MASGQNRLHLIIPIRKARERVKNVRCKFSQLVSNHVFCNCNVEIVLPVVDLKFEADKVWQDGGRPCLCFDR